jgi:hypothetical protein
MVKGFWIAVAIPFFTRVSRCRLAVESQILYCSANVRAVNSFIARWSLPACSYLVLSIFKGFDLVTFCLMWRQSESCHFPISSEHFTRMKPLATFGTTVDAVPIGDDVFLIAPIISGCHCSSSTFHNIVMVVLGDSPGYPPDVVLLQSLGLTYLSPWTHIPCLASLASFPASRYGAGSKPGACCPR